MNWLTWVFVGMILCLGIIVTTLAYLARRFGYAGDYIQAVGWLLLFWLACWALPYTVL